MISGFENKDYRNGFDEGYDKGRADAIDEFVEMFIAEGQKRKYLRHIWIEQTCKKIAEQLKEKK